VGVKHNVLNAKYHEQEAEIISHAGEKGMVTIATNMAGRGTDIFLGNAEQGKIQRGEIYEEVKALGGLKIIGTERHEARRIDNQLRGRAGRQGDPGDSRFYISLEDDLMRLFGGERMTKIVDALGMGEDDQIDSKMLSNAIENAQKKVEGNNFGVRKNILEYDQVMNEQREIIYGERNKVIAGADLRENVLAMLKAVINRAADIYTANSELPEEWDIPSLNDNLMLIFHRPAAGLTPETMKDLTRDEFKEQLFKQAVELYEMREEAATPERMREIERVIMMNVIDRKWEDHIDNMDQMRQGIFLRAYAQRDPLVEYKHLGFDMFQEMSDNIQRETIIGLYNVPLAVQQQPKMEEAVKREELITNKEEGGVKKPKKREGAKIGRNDPCPCGSGKKYKNCCLNKIS
jgi:preprotein translocase subunit SecA